MSWQFSEGAKSASYLLPLLWEILCQFCIYQDLVLKTLLSLLHINPSVGITSHRKMVLLIGHLLFCVLCEIWEAPKWYIIANLDSRESVLKSLLDNCRYMRDHFLDHIICHFQVCWVGLCHELLYLVKGWSDVGIESI